MLLKETCDMYKWCPILHKFMIKAFHTLEKMILSLHSWFISSCIFTGDVAVVLEPYSTVELYKRNHHISASWWSERDYDSMMHPNSFKFWLVSEVNHTWTPPHPLYTFKHTCFCSCTYGVSMYYCTMIWLIVVSLHIFTTESAILTHPISHLFFH